MTVDTAPASTTKDSFLRFALRLDAVCSGLVGIAMAAAAGPMSSLTGLPRAVEYALAAFFVAYGITVFGLSRLASVRTVGTWLIVGNLLFTVASIVVVLAGPWSLSAAGVVAVLAGGAFTLVMADLQFLGVRRMRA